MSSHYDRVPSQYATTRPSPIPGPSRGGAFYDRDRRIQYTSRPDADFIEDERVPLRRDDRLSHYPPQDYASSGPSRESRADFPPNNTTWSRHPVPVYTTPHHSPPPVPNQYPRYYQETRPPPAPQWDERPGWENFPDERNYQPSPRWGHNQRGPLNPPPYPQTRTWPNPPAPSPRSEDHRRREPIPIPVEPPQTRDYGRALPPEPRQYDDRWAQYYDHPPMQEHRTLLPTETRRQQQIDRPPPNNWENHTYRPEIAPTQHAQRTPPMRDYKRPRHGSIGPSRYPDNESAAWTRDTAFEPNRPPRQATFQPPTPVDARYRERTATGTFPSEPRRVFTGSMPPSPTKVHPQWEGSGDEQEFSGDEMTRNLTRDVHSLRQTPGEISRSRDAYRESIGRQEIPLRDSLDYGIPGLSNVSGARELRVEKAPESMVRRAWDPSSDRLVSVMEDDARSQWQAERTAAVAVSSSKVDHAERVHQSSSGRSLHVPHGSPVRPERDVYPSNQPPTVKSLNAGQGNDPSRQSVMSVHSLVSPSPVKPQSMSTASQRALTPLDLNDDNMQIEPEIAKAPSGRLPVAPEASMPAVARPHPIRAEERSSERPPLPAPRIELVPELERQPSMSTSPSVVEDSRIVTPEIETPEPDADAAVADVEIQIADTTISSPKPPVILQPGERISEDGTLVILAPRPKADAKDITEMLRRAVILRRKLDDQPREQRVNPILMDNLAKSDGPEQEMPSPTANYVEKIVDRVLSQAEEEQQMSLRAVLATKFAEERESLAEKQQRLRDEYTALHKEWLKRCAYLDSLFKANEMQEALSQPGRTTRRSAATLGDAVRSDLEMEQIIASLGNEDLTDPNHLAVRNVANIPDMISVAKGKVDYLFDDTNNEVDDPEGFYNPRSGKLDWTEEEQRIFLEKYAEYPKQYGIIAQYLPHKTPQQCVLYYYRNKKKCDYDHEGDGTIDFRHAVNAGNGKRRKGVRKGKQNALLADVAQADSKRPAARGRRGRSGFANGGRGRGGAPPPRTEENGDADSPAKRRRIDQDDAVSVDTDNNREASVLPPKKRRGRKPKAVVLATESPGESPAPGQAKPAEGAQTVAPPRRKPGSTATYWSESDREIFMRMLARVGKDFKRIALELPSKTPAQVQNYYKNHNKELGLEKVALAAANRPRSPEPDRFVNVSRAEASQSETPMEESAAEQMSQIAEANSSNGFSVEQNGTTGKSSPAPRPSSRAAPNKSVIKVMNADTFQSGSEGKSQGVLMTPSGQSSYTLSVAQQPAHQASSSMTATMNFQGSPESSGTNSATQRTYSGQEVILSRQTQDRPRSQPQPVIGTIPYPYTNAPPIPTPLSRLASIPLVSQLASAMSPPPRPSSHGSMDFRTGIPAHLLPTTHPGFWPASQTHGSPQLPGNSSSKPS